MASRPCPSLALADILLDLDGSGDSAFAHKAGVYNKFQGVVSGLSAQVFQAGDLRLALARPREVVV
jgi:hypothetical protein